MAGPLEKGGAVLTPKLWLIGMMSSGKTKVGRMLSRRSGFSFLDVDDEIVERAGMTIPRIFAEQGEPTFRMMEAEEVARICRTDGRVVVATGGGAILNPESRRLMRESGLVVWLNPPLSSLIAKGKTVNRPLLQGHADLGARYTEIWESRKHLYEETAHQRMDMDGKTRELVAEEVWKLWKAS